MFTNSSFAQDTRPTPKPRYDLLDWIKAADPVEATRFQTIESTSKEFQNYVDEIIGPTGDIKKDFEEEKILKLEFISILLAEHYQLRGLTFKNVIDQYGKPITIHKVKKEGFKLFKSTIGGMLINPPTANTLECYVYEDCYIWLVGETSVLALSPRSKRFDMFVKNQIQSESQ